MPDATIRLRLLLADLLTDAGALRDVLEEVVEAADREYMGQRVGLGTDRGKGARMSPKRHWQLSVEETFWDALIQLPAWPASLSAVDTLLLDLSHDPNPGEQISETKVFIAKTIASNPDDDSIVRLVLYFAKEEEEEGILRILFVDDYDHPTDMLNPHLDRLPKRDTSH